MKKKQPELKLCSVHIKTDAENKHASLVKWVTVSPAFKTKLKI